MLTTKYIIVYAENDECPEGKDNLQKKGKF